MIITTKSGSKQKGIGVNYSFSMVAEQASYWPELQEEYGAGSASLTTYASLNGKQYSPQEYFSFWSVYEGSTKVADRLWSRNMWGPKYGTDFGYGTDERGVGLTYMYHSLDFDRLRNERTDKPGSIIIDTYRDAAGATVYEPASTKFYDLVPFEAQDYYKGFYDTGFTFKNNTQSAVTTVRVLQFVLHSRIPAISGLFQTWVTIRRLHHSQLAVRLIR